LISADGNALRSRYGSFELHNDIVLSPNCDLYSRLLLAGGTRKLRRNLVPGTQTACIADSLDESGTLTTVPSLIQQDDYIVDLLDPNNQASVIDPAPASDPNAADTDVDGTRNDIGVMGGAFGERHYADCLDAALVASFGPWHEPLGAAALGFLFLAGTLVLRRRRRAGSEGIRDRASTRAQLSRAAE
jgi:hypothetical protein